LLRAPKVGELEALFIGTSPPATKIKFISSDRKIRASRILRNKSLEEELLNVIKNNLNISINDILNWLPCEKDNSISLTTTIPSNKIPYSKGKAITVDKIKYYIIVIPLEH